MLCEATKLALCRFRWVWVVEARQELKMSHETELCAIRSLFLTRQRNSASYKERKHNQTQQPATTLARLSGRDGDGTTTNYEGVLKSHLPCP